MSTVEQTGTLPEATSPPKAMSDVCKTRFCLYYLARTHTCKGSIVPPSWCFQRLKFICYLAIWRRAMIQIAAPYHPFFNARLSLHCKLRWIQQMAWLYKFPADVASIHVSIITSGYKYSLRKGSCYRTCSRQVDLEGIQFWKHGTRSGFQVMKLMIMFVSDRLKCIRKQYSTVKLGLYWPIPARKSWELSNSSAKNPHYSCLSLTLFYKGDATVEITSRAK